MTIMKIFRTLFVIAALVSTHWMGMTMARTFEVPADAQMARIPAVETANPVVDVDTTVPPQTVIAG